MQSPSGRTDAQRTELVRQRNREHARSTRKRQKAYVDDLDTMLRVYVRPARKLQILTAEQKSEIFSNVEDLSKCNAALLEQLQAPGDDAVATLARAFIAVAPFFKLYSTYCGNYQRALSTVAACRASGSGLSEVLASCSKNKDARGLSLESFLIKPVQRLTKYPLFWKDLPTMSWPVTWPN